MGPAETTGLVLFSVIVFQGLMKLISVLVDKFGNGTKSNSILPKDLLEAISDVHSEIKEKKCGLTEIQGQELKMLHDLHNIKDADGTPLWYVPRSWAVTQKETVDKLHLITETQFKIVDAVSRLERKLEGS